MWTSTPISQDKNDCAWLNACIYIPQKFDNKTVLAEHNFIFFSYRVLTIQEKHEVFSSILSLKLIWQTEIFQ